MLSLQEKIFKKLWDAYIPQIGRYKEFTANLDNIGVDHFAIIDLKSNNSGIDYMQRIFEIVGLYRRGAGYLPDKQNDFIWMTTDKNLSMLPSEALPQAVLADFRYEELSATNAKILMKYAEKSMSMDMAAVESIMRAGDEEEQDKLATAITKHLTTRQWPKPTKKEFLSVHEENQLAAWVLLYGRSVNHFGISLYQPCPYTSLSDFNTALENKFGLELNYNGGLIKGSKDVGLEQSSLLGVMQNVECSDAEVEVRNCFMEFVWRFPKKDNPKVLSDYFCDFVSQNANNVIESLFIQN